ncbi:MAG: dihydrolipoamide acetyltransferase family protein [Steroidobacteraceae bacterium]
MPSEFRMPALGADMDEGTVVQWNVAPGSAVKRGDVVAVVETDKGAIDVEIFEDGVVRELVVQPGTRVPVGTVLALIDKPGEAAEPPAPQPAAAAVSTAALSTPAPATSRPRVSPAARARARELRIDLASIRGSGPGGAITLDDVERSSPQPTAHSPQPSSSSSPQPTAHSPQPSSMRAAIAAAMSRSKREIPHYYLSLAMDLTPAMEWLAASNATKPVTERVLLAALLVKAVALACREMPAFSGFYREGRYEPSPSAHVGVAVAIRGGGLVAPAIMDTADKTLEALMEDFRGLVLRARAGRLRASELAAPTIVLTSLGDAAVDAVFPIIQPPQVAIIGAGAPALRPWIVNGAVVPRQVLTLSLGADHRVTDGRLGAQFLARIAELLATPQQL